MKSLNPLNTPLPYRLVGVFCDYFAAGDAESAAELMDQTGGESPLTVHSGPVEGVEAEGIDPAVALGKIVALILGLEWEPGLVPVRPVWEADLECHEGPWVLEIGEVAVRALASITTTADLVRSLPNTDPERLAETLKSLAALAFRTSAAGERLYCWVAL